MYRLLEPKKDTILETDQYFFTKWLSCKDDPNCGAIYTKFMTPIRRKVEIPKTENHVPLYLKNIIEKIEDQTAVEQLRLEKGFDSEKLSGLLFARRIIREETRL